MVTTKIIYLGDRYDNSSNDWYAALGNNAIRGEYSFKLNRLLENLNTIEDVLQVAKNTPPPAPVSTKNTVLIVKIDESIYYLSNKFEIIPEPTFKKLNFAPYIEFDISNCDISRELRKVNAFLKYKSSDEALEFVKEYIKNPTKSYKSISLKPKKICLYHSFGGGCLEFLGN